ncbi:hypothetical protein ES332_D10G055700v1 [Gossypium tomentosum]|uniref:non-specific serine/threonine protein kinase n=1 Tax=Gossypium tomentosum TaxID=34277 RepID=A0A5D2J136_GOSTO|nr:hypothetical protein ES332_D10G055700v1 [Gossypium tomentosum]
MKPRVTSSWKGLLYYFFFLVVMTNATTDPSEVKALNSIFQQWNAQAVASWNTTEDPCSGTALSQGLSEFEDPSNNPAITCDCSFNDNTVCHITRLRVFGLDKRGVLPKELLDLPYLDFLKLDRNFFSGPLPAFIGNMSRLGLLSLAHNNFSGTIPKEFGNLKKLYLLSLGNNDIFGKLPPELGNLAELGELYINSCALSGEMPSTFAKLKDLRTVWASDNAFTGKIPDFFGNLTKLTALRFQGNSFEGPIPSSLGNLTSLTSLRIGDIYNGSSSSLDFIRNLKNLTDLVLRNVLLTGNLPSYITELQYLQKLDLSFNNLTGRIPSVLFTMKSLEYLFLGNNGLSGSIPSQKSETLTTIDLSYNFLSGNLPSWVNSRLQLNLVANNFTFNSSINRNCFEIPQVLPGLECLQRSFPCFRNAPRYAKFSIKCGGPAMIADGISFDVDNSTLGPATFNISSIRKWAVSNAGLFAERPIQQYVQNFAGTVSGTNTPKLYETSRLSPGSLRYYGLGLENGSYTVRLFFAETGFPELASQSWKSLGRRVFDVYIQGTRQLRDFDISKEAGGVNKAIIRNFTTNVIGNHLEIHLFWAGKGTTGIPTTGTYGPAISAISVVPNFKPSVSGLPPDNPKKKKHTALIAGVTIPVVALALILIFSILYMKREKEDDDDDEGKSIMLLGISPRPNTFSYSELKAATEDFNPSNKLGEGGFGPGTLSDGKVVAVKQLSVASNQGKDQFVTEIATISAVQHRNLVKLYGCCIGGNRRLLVYEYLVNKSLDHALWGQKDLHLDWPTRFNICLLTAKGLAYLHEESRPKIVHRDLCPKISDFGLAKLYDDKKTHITSRAAGTVGYLAPEYAMRGHLTEKVDVFSFGVAWTLHENNQLLSLLDPTLAEFDENEALRVIGVAFLCTQASPSLRPSMSRVIAMLVGDTEVGNVTTKPSYLTDCDFKDVTGDYEDKTDTFMDEESQKSNASDHSSNGIKSKNNTLSRLNDQPMLSSVNVSGFRESIGEGR